MKLKITTLIFDFDGVIVDSGADIAGSINYTLRHFGYPTLPAKEIVSYVGRGAENLIRRSFKNATDELILTALPFYKEYYLEHCVVETKLYENLKETLEYFANKKKAVVTNKPEALTVKILKELGVFQHFDLIIGPESVKELKPNQEGLLKVLDAFQENPANAIMIGDSHTDVEVGKKARMHTCGVTYGLGDKEKLTFSEPDFLIDNIGKLMEVIE